MKKSLVPAPSFKERAKDLAAKALSIKVIVFMIGSGLLVWGKIDAGTWLALAGLLVGVRALEKKLWEKIGK